LLVPLHQALCFPCSPPHQLHREQQALPLHLLFCPALVGPQRPFVVTLQSTLSFDATLLAQFETLRVLDFLKFSHALQPDHLPMLQQDTILPHFLYSSVLFS